MNKPELVKKVAEKVEGTKKEAQVYVDAILSAMVEGFAEDKEVKITGYFTISEKEVAERECLKNPRQPELGKVVVPAHKAPKVKLGSEFKNLYK